MLGRHMTLEINEPLRKGSATVGTYETAVRAVILEQVLDEQVLIGKLVGCAAGTFQKIFAVQEEIGAWS